MGQRTRIRTCEPKRAYPQKCRFFWKDVLKTNFVVLKTNFVANKKLKTLFTKIKFVAKTIFVIFVNYPRSGGCRLSRLHSRILHLSTKIENMFLWRQIRLLENIFRLNLKTFVVTCTGVTVRAEGGGEPCAPGRPVPARASAARFSSPGKKKLERCVWGKRKHYFGGYKLFGKKHLFWDFRLSPTFQNSSKSSQLKIWSNHRNLACQNSKSFKTQNQKSSQPTKTVF